MTNKYLNFNWIISQTSTFLLAPHNTIRSPIIRNIILLDFVFIYGKVCRQPNAPLVTSSDTTWIKNTYASRDSLVSCTWLSGNPADALNLSLQTLNLKHPQDCPYNKILGWLAKCRLKKLENFFFFHVLKCVAGYSWRGWHHFFS